MTLMNAILTSFGALAGADATAVHAQVVTNLHDACLARVNWPQDDSVMPADGAWRWIAANHLFNSRLWAEEDLARRTQVAADDIALNKRRIDAFNQSRNDATERVDELLLIALGLVDEASAHSDAPRSLAPAGARLNSETAGSMIDRLSILALKIDAMRKQAVREDVDADHRDASAAKLHRLQAQRDDLAGCLDALLADAQAKRAYFKVYRQFKMYNDARFNPALVAERNAGMA